MQANVAQAALTWLSYDDKPRLLVNSELQVLWCNQRALHCLSGLSEVQILDGKLCFTSEHDTDRFVNQLNLAKHETNTWLLRLTALQRIIIMSSHNIIVEQQHLTAIEILCDDDETTRKSIMLADQLGLTNAEKAVLQGFTEGLSPQEIAAHRRVGIETIRAQIKTLYQKLGVCTREQMFKKIAPFRR